MLLMDGDISNRSLSFASAYGELTYINNKNTGAPRTINLLLKEGAVADAARRRPRTLLQRGPALQGLHREPELHEGRGVGVRPQGALPHLNIKRLIGSDSGETKRQALEDINETLEDVNVFLYSPVIESGVDITVKVKKVYGLLSSNSNSQRAFLQMINRCRCVEDPNMDFLNDGEAQHQQQLQLLEVRRGPWSSTSTRWRTPDPSS